MQFAENLSDRQAAEAVRTRIDWKYAFGLDLTNEGFHYSVLSAMRTCLVDGETDALAELARGRRRAKRGLLAQAVTSRLVPHPAFLLTEQLAHLGYLEEAIAHNSAEIDQRLAAERQTIALLDTIPGVSQRSAEVLIAKQGLTSAAFPARVTSRPGRAHLQAMMGAQANAGPGGLARAALGSGRRWSERRRPQRAPRTRNLAAQHRRLAARRRAKRAVVAGAHPLLVMVCALLTQHAIYHELRRQYFDACDRQAVQRRVVRQLEALGYAVSLYPTSSSAA